MPSALFARRATWSALLLCLAVSGCQSPGGVADASTFTSRDGSIFDGGFDGSLDGGFDGGFDGARGRDASEVLFDGGVATDGASTVTTLRVHYPAGAHALAVRGDGNLWSWQRGVAMVNAAPDTWVYSTDALLAPAEWKPLLDDATWSRGPNYRVAPGDTVDVYPHFLRDKGRVVKLIASLHSKALANDRDVWAYLPPAYDENPLARFPVLYMHDGQNLFDPALAFGGHPWGVDVTLDAADGALLRDASIRETIVVGVDNTGARIYEYTPTYDASVKDGGGGDLYLKFLVEELKPAVDQMLRTLPGRADTAMLGSSLGGLLSCYAGVRRADVFGVVGAMSPSTWWDGKVILDRVAHTSADPALRPLRVYVDSGDSPAPSNDDVVDTGQLADTYRMIGYVDGRTLQHVVQAGGQHSEIYWAQRLPAALHFLLGPRP